MAKTKAQLLDEAKAAELVPADADPDGYTAENLTACCTRRTRRRGKGHSARGRRRWRRTGM
jgi:hypothetical protein